MLDAWAGLRASQSGIVWLMFARIQRVHDAAGPVLVLSGPSAVGKTTTARLVASTFRFGVHLRTDDFTYAIVAGFVEPQRAEAAHQNEVVGGASAAAALSFAAGGYVVVLDGHVFPSGVEGLATTCAARGVELHYAVLRADLPICLMRATKRVAHDADRGSLGSSAFTDLHARFSGLGDYERNVIDASGSVDDVAAAVIAAFRAGALVIDRPSGPT